MISPHHASQMMEDGIFKHLKEMELLILFHKQLEVIQINGLLG